MPKPSLRLIHVFGLLAAGVGTAAAQAVDTTCSNPTSKPGEGASAEKDNPAARGAWFLNGRRNAAGPGTAGATDQAPPASNLLRSLQQVATMAGLGLAGPPVAWTALGPAPQKSLYWGNVSGRVTSLAVDNRGPGHVLYVGTAFGGLWKTDDYTARAPSFAPVGDTLWPSLAVGSIALDTRQAGKTVMFVGTGEGNQSSDSYYGVGMLKSTDLGATWSLSTGAGGFSDLRAATYNEKGPFVGAAISKILIDPSDSQRLIIAVSSSSLGKGSAAKPAIYQSLDGGNTWSPMSLTGVPSATYNPSDLVYDSANHTYYAAVQALGIYKLVSGAAGWTPVSSPFAAAAVNATNFDRASLAVRSAGGQTALYALISAGWITDKNPGNDGLSMPSQGDTGFAVSTDGGATWRPISPPPTLFGDADDDKQGFYDQWIATPAGQSLILGGVDIWQSPDSSGAKWTNVTQAYNYKDGLNHPERHVHPDQHAIVALDASHWIVGNDGGVWSTSDGGKTWSDLNTGINSIQLMSATPMAGAPGGYLGGSQDNGTAVGGAGLTWSTTLSGDGGFTAANPSRPSQYFTERYNVGICRSDDSGRTWNIVVSSASGTKIPDDSAFYVPFQFLRNAAEIVLGTSRVWLGSASPGSPGHGWRAISGPLPGDGYFIQSVASAPSSPQVVYVATGDSQVFASSDIHAAHPETTWASKTTADLPADRVFSALAIDPKDANIVYLAVQGFNTGHLYRTDDGGTSWKDITISIPDDPLPVPLNTPVNAILVDPAFPQWIYIATDVGVFASSNRGNDKSWQMLGAGLPHTAVLDLKMASRKILAATHGRGAWLIDAPAH
jgi:photosystem II stability/assembly factor-like uncharacterized protein